VKALNNRNIMYYLLQKNYALIRPGQEWCKVLDLWVSVGEMNANANSMFFNL
jgi:hypothetical protein